MGNDHDIQDQVFSSRRDLKDKYSLENPGNLFNYRKLRPQIDHLLHMAFPDMTEVRLLDVGCGELFWCRELQESGILPANCFGTDLLGWRIKKGHEQGRAIPAVAASAAQLPFASQSFSLVTQFTMMTSVLDRTAREMISYEMMRVLRPGGYILWFDFRYNNPANKHTRAIGRRELQEYFQDMPVHMETTNLLPQLARKLTGIGIPLLKIFYAIPILRTHYLALIGPKG